jgi:hypothetical protein
MMFHESKTGNGAYEVCEAADGRVVIQIEQDAPRFFDTPQTAYDYCVDHFENLQGTMRGFSYLNAAEYLKDWIDS